jgi:hypothetical protein
VTCDRLRWQPILLRELERMGRLGAAADFADVPLRTVRRHVVRDKQRLGADDPCALGRLIDGARAAHTAEQAARRLRAVPRRAAAALNRFR